MTKRELSKELLKLARYMENRLIETGQFSQEATASVNVSYEDVKMLADAAYTLVAK